MSEKFKIQELVKIGAFTIPVIFKKGMWTDRGHRGEFSPSNKEIRLDPDLADDLLWEVFVHEVIEAIVWAYNLETKHLIIDVLSMNLAQALEPILVKE
jgi:hypothetical protein